MVSPQYFFVREIEQMNYFCSAYPEVVKGEVGQSHAGDVFWELLQDLRVLCLQVDKKNEAYHFIQTPQIHSMLLTKSNTYDACSSCLFYETLNVTTYAGLSDLYFEYMRGSQSLVVVVLDERLFVCWRDSRDAIYLNHCDYTEYISDSDLGYWIRSVLHLLINIDWLNVNWNFIVHFTMNYKLKLFVYLLGNHWPDSLR